MSEGDELKMFIVGVTGGIGSGKSTVCRILNECGAAVVDADKISHSIMNKGTLAYNECIEFFGADILDSRNEIDRKRLAETVFNDKTKLKALNRITHKYIFAEMKNQIQISENSHTAMTVLDVPLLFDSDFPIKCDVTVGVAADEKIRIVRASKRDGAATEEIRKRIQNQIPDSEYYRLADFVIENNGSEEELTQRVRELYRNIAERKFKRE